MICLDLPAGRCWLDASRHQDLAGDRDR
jgi:hypothetical protein